MSSTKPPTDCPIPWDPTCWIRDHTSSDIMGSHGIIWDHPRNQKPAKCWDTLRVLCKPYIAAGQHLLVTSPTAIRLVHSSSEGGLVENSLIRVCREWSLLLQRLRAPRSRSPKQEMEIKKAGRCPLYRFTHTSFPRS